MKICRKCTGEYAWQSAISIKLLLHIFRTPFPNNTQRTAFVNWEINNEKWEKIRLDDDANITITI